MMIPKHGGEFVKIPFHDKISLNKSGIEGKFFQLYETHL